MKPCIRSALAPTYVVVMVIVVSSTSGILPDLKAYQPLRAEQKDEETHHHRQDGASDKELGETHSVCLLPVGEFGRIELGHVDAVVDLDRRTGLKLVLPRRDH